MNPAVRRAPVHPALVCAYASKRRPNKQTQTNKTAFGWLVGGRPGGQRLPSSTRERGSRGGLEGV
eukprot:1651081-Pyramimonas_sp.AAC.1